MNNINELSKIADTVGLTDVVVSDSSVMSGIPCFKGTRVPVKILYDFIDKNYNVAYFLDQFPTVSAQQVREVLRISQSVLSKVS
jgi:uncharacterized protein (DUF433 family)